MAIDNLEKLKSYFLKHGCTSLYIKPLAENDNSKNQIYFGSDFTAINIFPNLKLSAEKDIIKAALGFEWLTESGSIFTAPNTQLIFYPQYPEVRLSGFLRGCTNAPSSLLADRQKGRILFLGIKPDGKIIGYVIKHSNPIVRQLPDPRTLIQTGVFLLLPLSGKKDSRTLLLNALKQISDKGWINSVRLIPGGGIVPCNAPQCGGYTLEAQLGIVPNGISAPDYLGWEIKAHDKRQHIITLMTPEPDGGYYHTSGVIAFVKRYGYNDLSGIPDRMNFGGLHKVNERNTRTGLKLKLQGYNATNNTFRNSGSLNLISSGNNRTASWSFIHLMEIWNRKHALAAYIQSECRETPRRKYKYSNEIKLCYGTDFTKLLQALAAKSIYYDPGIKVEHVSTSPVAKNRSQFRIHTSNIDSIYFRTETVSL